VAMYVEGVWWIPDFATGIKDFGWDVALLPKHPTTGKRSTTIESDGWWIYKGAKEQDASWKLLQYLAGTDGQKRFSDVNFVIPSAFPEIGTEWYSKNPPEHRMKVLDNIKTDSIKVDLSYFEYSTIQNTVGAIIDKAFADGTDIEKVMVDADKAMNDELKKAWDLFKA
jgi:ABC-type glycerol-3-phosphate transport system substrate-binding protein